MTPPTLPRSPRGLRLAPAVLVALLAACGEDPVDTAASNSNSNGNTDATVTDTGTNPSNAEASDTTPTTSTTNSDNSQSGSESSTGAPGTDTTNTVTGSPTSDTETDTTTPPQTDTTNPVDSESASDTSTSTGPDDTSTSTGDTGTTVDPDTTNGESDTNQPVQCECPDIEVPLDDGIFVLSDNAELWKFFPEDNSFLKLGSFVCQGQTSTFSMAVDRLGFAWVMFQNGQIFKVDVTNPDVCLPSGYVNNQMGVNLFGMGFVSNSAIDQCDSLYGNTFSGGGFSEGPNQGQFIHMNPDTLMIEKLGFTTFNGAEVSGTGDGRVFTFGGVNPAKLVEVDRTNGAYLSTLKLTGLETTNGFAFSHFAGDFYIFTESDDIFAFASKVTHVDYDDSDNNGIQDVTTVVAEAPLRIVGAGVSTCAPYMPQ